MFNGFKSKYVKVKKGKVFCRVGGEGPPLLLLHGYPQTHLMWHKTAPELSKRFTVVAADLRGYGNSLAPASDNKHYNYSKREMASDMKQMMIKLGFNKFFVAGHDRGGRVAHRLARDHRNNILALKCFRYLSNIGYVRTNDERFRKSLLSLVFFNTTKMVARKNDNE